MPIYVRCLVSTAAYSCVRTSAQLNYKILIIWMENGFKKSAAFLEFRNNKCYNWGALWGKKGKIQLTLPVASTGNNATINKILKGAKFPFRYGEKDEAPTCMRKGLLAHNLRRTQGGVLFLIMVCGIRFTVIAENLIPKTDSWNSKSCRIHPWLYV